jgi:diadenylate cyclase
LADGSGRLAAVLDYNCWSAISRKEPYFVAPAGTWPHLGLVSVIDILVVAFIIYEFLALIRGTRAALILIGISVVFLAFYLSRFGQLVTLHWLISRVLPYAVFALIVIFAPEIRQGLARLGRRLTVTHSSPTAADAYDDVVMATNLFSQNQTGALIVIEREIGLRTYIESGVAIDAQLSYDLLATLFRPSAPLHDGAVIIRGDRIAAAACFLPLSMNPVLSTQLGTRHRAGIGITEETDAMAIIVSEETGSISLAVGGAIEREVTVEQLRQRMSGLLRRYVPPTPLPTTISDSAAMLEEENEMPLRSSDSHAKPGGGL